MSKHLPETRRALTFKPAVAPTVAISAWPRPRLVSRRVVQVEIEYCVACGFLDRAIEVARLLLNQFGTRLAGSASHRRRRRGVPGHG